MDELADSAPWLDDSAELRRRLAADGYLFFRGLLPAAQVRAAGDAVLAQLQSGGWADDRGIPSIQPRAVNPMDALTDQRPGPTPAELILGPTARPPEMFSRLFRRERWWEPVPDGLTLHPRAQLITVPPGPSQLICVHPGWRHWQPSPAVH